MTELYHVIQPPKTCRKCNLEKSLTRFDKDPDCHDGYKNICRDCINARRRQKTQERKPVFPPGHKRCTKCKEVKPFSEFGKASGKKDGLMFECRNCYNKRRKRDPEQKREYDRNRRDSIREYELRRSKVYYQANRESALEKDRIRRKSNPEKVKAKTRAYYTANRLKFYEQYKRRIARQKGATIGKVSYNRILGRDGMLCHICEQAIQEEQKIHFDHVIPLSRGGSHTEENIKVSHSVCNIRKLNFLMEELTTFQRRGPDS